jgi:endonuclease I
MVAPFTECALARKHHALIGLVVGILLAACDGGGSVHRGGVEAVDSATGAALPAPALIDEYYASVDGLSGEALKAALQTLLEGDHIALSYREVWGALQYTDQDPDNAGNIILIYTGRSHDKNDRYGQPGSSADSWNREHVWPKSMGFRSRSFLGHNDIHHIRPSDGTVNESRGNLDFDAGGEPVTEAPDTFGDGDSWEPRDGIKGDVARMIFYMDVRYDGNDGSMPDLSIVNDTRSSSGESVIGVLCTLYRWHRDDGVDAFEARRNDRIQQWQGNRNPFIDHPQWVDEIYGADCAGP